MAARTLMLTGRDAVLAADKLRQIRENQDRWPYIDLYAPPGSIHVHHMTLVPVATPAALASAEVLLYRVPEGFAFVMTAIVQQYQGGQFTWGDGTWTVNVNTPTGVANVQATPVQGLVNLPVPLGSFNDSGPWQLPRSILFEPLDEIRSVFTAGAGGVAGGLLVSLFSGYLVPWTQIDVK